MSSSIFNFETIGRAMRLPAKEKGWIAFLALAFTAIVLVAPAIMAPLVKRTNAFTTANEAVSEQTKVVFFGSSHVANCIKPSKFDVPTISFNLEAADYSTLYAVAHHHIDKFNGVELAVIELTPLSLMGNAFRTYGGDYRNAFDLGIDIDALNIDPKFKENIQAEARGYRSYFWPLFAFRKPTPRNLILRPSTEDLEPGFRPKERNVNLIEDGKARTTHLYRGKLNQGNVDRNHAAFLKLIRLFTDRKIPIVLLWTPKHESFLVNRPESVVHLLNKVVDEARTNASDDVILIWNDEVTPLLESSDFADADHLRGKGADKYSALLNERVMQVMK